MTKKEALERAIAIAGSQEKLGALFTPPVSQQAVQQWLDKGETPVKRCKVIERGTGVTREQLRPDHFGSLTN